MTQNNNLQHKNSDLTAASVFAAQRQYRYKKKTYATSQTKAMAVVLAVAFVLSAITALAVSALAKNHSPSEKAGYAVTTEYKESEPSSTSPAVRQITAGNVTLGK